MDLNTIMPWLAAAALILGLGNTITTFLTSGSKENTRRIANCEKRQAELESRLQSVEDEIKHLPDRGMVHELQLTLKDIQIEMASIKAATEQSTRTSRRVEEYLLSHAKATA